MRSANCGRVRSRARARGFGLLESIVAMAILGSAGLVLFGWLQSSLETASRFREAEQRARLQLEAQAWASALNPMVQPEGETELGALRIRWKSEALEPVRDEFDYGGQLQPVWRVALYAVSFEVSQGPVKASWRQQIAGFESRFKGPRTGAGD